MDERERLDLMREIERTRGSKLICYITSDRLGLPGPIWSPDVRVIERHLAAIARDRQTKKLDFLIYTPGGDALAPWSLVAMIREYLGSRPFSVLIPSMAMSAGTMISIGSDEIVMAPGAHIGPIDIQVGPGVSVEDVRGYFDLADSAGLKQGEGRLQAFLTLARSIHPVVLGALQRVRTEGERTALLLLSGRRKPLSESANRKVAHHLLREVGIHGQSIRRTEARALGLSFIVDSEQAGIDGPMADLFEAYETLLKLDVPFVGQSSGMADDDNPFQPSAGRSDVIADPIAVVESLDRLDIARLAYGQRFWRDGPQHHITPERESAASAHFQLSGRPPARRFSGEADDLGMPEVKPEATPDGIKVAWETVRRR